MTLNKIPTFQEVKDWVSANYNNYTDAEAAAAAPVQTVDGNTADYEIQQDGTDGTGVINFKTQ